MEPPEKGTRILMIGPHPVKHVLGLIKGCGWLICHVPPIRLGLYPAWLEPHALAGYKPRRVGSFRLQIIDSKPVIYAVNSALHRDIDLAQRIFPQHQ